MTDTLPFAKFQGAGNDFVILDGRPGAPAAGLDWAQLAQQMCDRHYGVGGDGILVAAEPSAGAAARGAAFRMRMFNPDGSESEMCGNGLRCFARWLADAGEIESGAAHIETGAGILRVTLAAQPDDAAVSAWMGVPDLSAGEVRVPEAGVEADGTRVSTGNPHAVFFVEDVAAVPLETLGPRVEHHPAFPNRTNVEFVQVRDSGNLKVRVWERGAGATLACGTGACAAMVAARVRGLVDKTATLELPGGTLEVRWPGPGQEVVLSGPAVRVYDGSWPLRRETLS
jgi:diaminopimelate epimerase